jgi:outer membrane protein assembly factor BamB
MWERIAPQTGCIAGKQPGTWFVFLMHRPIDTAPDQKKERSRASFREKRPDNNRIMERSNNHHGQEKRLLFWLCLILLVGTCSGTVLLFHSLHTPANRHYLLAGQTVFAFEGGRKLWQYHLPGKRSSLPRALLVKDRLYVAAGPVLALDKETGKLLWQRQIPFVATLFTQQQIATALFWKEEKLYVETDAQCLIRLDPQTGAILWEYAGEEAEISPPAFSSRGDVVYVVTRQQIGTSTYEVTALSTEKRRLLWQQCFVLPAQWDRVQTPVVQEELLLVPLGDTVIVLRTTDGHLLSTSAHVQGNFRYKCA